MTPNVELLESVMRHIDDHPEQHDQRVWINECGTAACFAGWACLLSGWQVGLSSDSYDNIVISSDTLTKRPTAIVAMELLGLSWETSLTLFQGDNTREMLHLMVKDLVNGDELRGWDEYRDEVAS